MRSITVRFGIASVLFSLVLLVSLVRQVPAIEDPVTVNAQEQWRSDFAAIRTIDDALPIIQQYSKNQTGTREERITKAIDQFIKDRFVFGFSYISPKENWLIYLFGIIFGSSYTVPVDPNDILKHPQAMCSQQSIVFMELLRRYNIQYGAVLFNWPDSDPGKRGHFAVAARVDGVWRYFDADLETKGSPPVSTVIDGSALASLYRDKPAMAAKMRYAARHHGISLEHINEYPAPRGRALQVLTNWVSYLMPFMLLFAGLALWPGSRRILRTCRSLLSAVRVRMDPDWANTRQH